MIMAKVCLESDMQYPGWKLKDNFDFMKGHGVGGEDGVKRGNGIDRPSQERHNEVDRRMKAVESDEILRRIAENQAYIKSQKERAQAWQIAQADPDQIAL